MSSANVQILVAMLAYLSLSIGIGIWFAKRSNKNAEAYFLGERGLGPWVAAMSAEASDMSGWLLMGLPGVAYFTGAGEAVWTAIGLALGTWINWRIVAQTAALVFEGRRKRDNHPRLFQQPLSRQEAYFCHPWRLSSFSCFSRSMSARSSSRSASSSATCSAWRNSTGAWSSSVPSSC